MELSTSAKVWFSSITNTTCAECGTPLVGVGLGAGEGAGLGDGAGDGPGVGPGAGVGAGVGVGEVSEFAPCAVEPPQPAARSKVKTIANATSVLNAKRSFEPM